MQNFRFCWNLKFSKALSYFFFLVQSISGGRSFAEILLGNMEEQSLESTEFLQRGISLHKVSLKAPFPLSSFPQIFEFFKGIYVLFIIYLFLLLLGKFSFYDVHLNSLDLLSLLLLCLACLHFTVRSFCCNSFCLKALMSLEPYLFPAAAYQTDYLYYRWPCLSEFHGQWIWASKGDIRFLKMLENELHVLT